ncbi:hypothetical protein DPMN_034607 [Dreissena polymorpha]|uniref:Uncharacterized protein n=2 Tax=Dreissena polymorpha TaxID=45954 RepID=A0A9D4M9D6_DREPO|nr:hypothetical protein DPMN_034607 [Dreissena polymorpha]
MWQENSASPLHLLHGGFGIGSFIIPLISNPFLAVKADEDQNTTTVTSTSAPMTTAKSYLKESRIEYAYAIAAVIVVVVSVVFYIYHCNGVRKNAQGVANASKTENEDGKLDDGKPKALSFRQMFNPATCANGRVFYGVQIFFLVFLFFFQAVGGERIAGKFIRSYAIEYLDFSQDDAIYLNTVFWIAFTCGRIGAFVAAHWVPIRILIMIETGGCLASGIALVFLGTRSHLALWVIMPIFGVFIAPLFPSGISWANFHIDVTGIAITIFLLGGSVGGIAYMKVMGFLFDNYGPKTFLYTLLAYGIAVFLLSTIMNLVGAQHGSRFEANKKRKEIDISELGNQVVYAEKF